MKKIAKQCGISRIQKRETDEVLSVPAYKYERLNCLSQLRRGCAINRLDFHLGNCE